MFSISGEPAASSLARVPIIRTSVLTSAAAGEQSHYLLNNLVRVIITWRGQCETAVTCRLGGVHGPRPLLLSHTTIALIFTLIRN